MVEVLPPDRIELAVDALRRGGLVAFPTETVYGLGADAGRAEAVAGIFAAKGRPAGHPLIVHIADPAHLDRYVTTVTPVARALAEAFWPGPLTIVLGRAETVAPQTTGGLDTVGIRVPDHPVALDLLRRFGGGVAAPSANRFGAVSPTTAQHVIDDLGSGPDQLIDYVIDGGPTPVGVESTIVDATGDAPILLRPGGISVVELEAVAGPVVDGRSGPSRASGMLVSHYAPRAVVELVDDVTAFDGLGPDVGVIAPTAVDHNPSWKLPADAAGYAAELYATLRAADGDGVARLLVMPPIEGALLDAVLDRLAKAAAPR